MKREFYENPLKFSFPYQLKDILYTNMISKRTGKSSLPDCAKTHIASLPIHIDPHNWQRRLKKEGKLGERLFQTTKIMYIWVRK